MTKEIISGIKIKFKLQVGGSEKSSLTSCPHNLLCCVGSVLCVNYCSAFLGVNSIENYVICTDLLSSRERKLKQ